MADIIRTDDDNNKEYIGGYHIRGEGDIEFSLVRDREKAVRFREDDLRELDFGGISCLVAYIKSYFGNEKSFESISV